MYVNPKKNNLIHSFEEMWDRTAVWFDSTLIQPVLFLSCSFLPLPRLYRNLDMIPG